MSPSIFPVILSFVVLLSGAVQAQEPVAEPPAAASAPVKSAEELAIEAQARAFSASTQTMQDEIVAAWPDGDFEAILQPRREEAGALADRMEAFLRAYAATLDGEARAAEDARTTRSIAHVRQLPDLIGQVVMRGLKARDEAAAALPADTPDAPPTTPAQTASGDPDET
ncbi:hypothetical protein ACO2Q1_09150 [Brevundimonas sp. VNH65]|uniref:hypothetical protein n=1 Tax=Brevundimonas sp. VNH65 TaxID=3400917 RepID=UPI003C021601